MCPSNVSTKCVIQMCPSNVSVKLSIDVANFEFCISSTRHVCSVISRTQFFNTIQDKAVTYELQVRKRPYTLTYCDVFIVVIISILYLCFVLLCRVFCILCVCTFPVIIMYCVLCVSFHFFFFFCCMVRCFHTLSNKQFSSQVKFSREKPYSFCRIWQYPIYLVKYGRQPGFILTTHLYMMVFVIA